MWRLLVQQAGHGMTYVPLLRALILTDQAEYITKSIWKMQPQRPTCREHAAHMRSQAHLAWVGAGLLSLTGAIVHLAPHAANEQLELEGQTIQHSGTISEPLGRPGGEAVWSDPLVRLG